MKTYRKRRGYDTWHWCRNCSNDPKSDYVEENSSARPKSGELCNECLGKERNENCR